MIRIKHLMDAIERNDGQRLWVEPIGLTRDLQQWCGVDFVLSYLGPPLALWEWFEQHPDGYDYFRATYQQHLNKSPFARALRELATAAGRQDFTLLHSGDCPEHNTAAALAEFLSYQSHSCPPEA